MDTIYDRADQSRILSTTRDPQLKALLQRRFALLITADHDLTDWTVFIIVAPGDSEHDLIREAGFSPLVEPIDGGRFGSDGFQPFWDHLDEEDGHFVLTISFGSTFAYVLIVPDADGILPELRHLCRRFAA